MAASAGDLVISDAQSFFLTPDAVLQRLQHSRVHTAAHD